MPKAEGYSATRGIRNPETNRVRLSQGCPQELPGGRFPRQLPSLAGERLAVDVVRHFDERLGESQIRLLHLRL
jgi:hypothetical protein